MLPVSVPSAAPAMGDHPEAPSGCPPARAGGPKPYRSDASSGRSVVGAASGVSVRVAGAP